MKQSEYKKYYDFIYKIVNDIDSLSKLKINDYLNRNFQYQIYLLSNVYDDKNVLKEIINFLKTKELLIHFFNEYLSIEQIDSLLETNQNKLIKGFDSINKKDVLNHELNFIKNEINSLKAISNKSWTYNEYVNAFIKSRNKKWYKKINNKAKLYTCFYWVAPKKKKQKFQKLLNELIDNFNVDYNLSIDINNVDETFLKLFNNYIYSNAIKQVLIYTLIGLFIALLVIIGLIIGLSV